MKTNINISITTIWRSICSGCAALWQRCLFWGRCRCSLSSLPDSSDCFNFSSRCLHKFIHCFFTKAVKWKLQSSIAFHQISQSIKTHINSRQQLIPDTTRTWNTLFMSSIRHWYGSWHTQTRLIHSRTSQAWGSLRCRWRGANFRLWHCILCN